MPKSMWFGTLERALWIDCPVSGPDMSPIGWGDEGTLLSGGGYARNSVGSHKEYVFEWKESSTRQAAQLMKSYADGAYGRGLLYFLDPLTYDTNVLPARWANPAMACDDEGPPHVYGAYPEENSVSGWETNQLPVNSAYYNLESIDSGYRDDLDTVFIPIPTGYTLHLGAFYSATGSGGVFATPVNTNGTLGTDVELTALANNSGVVVDDTFTGVKGVRIWVGKSSAGVATVTFVAMVGRLIQSSKTPSSTFTSGPWIGGMGHSGCRFVGKPTYVPNSGTEGGRIGYAATFKEVGSWV